MTARPALAYKVLTTPQMERLEAEGSFAGSPADLADGFIHLSTAGQLEATLARHFAGQHGLHLVAVDVAALGEAVKWETARDGADFPHLYAPLTLDAVIAYSPLAREEDGSLRLPVAG
jgi:uncharacterized protein (DUF952 family)